jgi:hypothetical protein
LTAFSLTVDSLETTPTAANLMVSVNGVIQEPNSAFTITGSTITFTEAPATGSTFFGVVMGEASYIAYGTVGADEMGVTEGAVTASKGIVLDSSKNIQGLNQVTATQFVGGGAGITGVTAEWDGTHTGDGNITGTLTFGSLTDGAITATAFESSLTSGATLVPTSAAVKTYVDAQVTAQDLDFQGDSGGALNIDLDSETLDIAGDGAGISTAGSGNQITISGDHDALTNFVAGEHFTQANITTTGTVTAGVWNSTFGAVPNALISGSFSAASASLETNKASKGFAIAMAVAL